MQQDITFQTHWLKKYILSFNTKVKHLSAIASLLFSLCEQSTSVVALPFHQQWWFHQILIYTTRECLLSIYGKIVIERFFFSFQFAKVFLVIQNFLSWKTAWPFILTVFNSQFLRMLFAIFCWNWPSGSITNVTIKKRAYVQTIVHVACKKRCVLIFESVPLRL